LRSIHGTEELSQSTVIDAKRTTAGQPTARRLRAAAIVPSPMITSFDAEVAGDRVVAASPREGRVGLLVVAAWLLAENAMAAGALPIAAVLSD
jgi:hypothetical protein